MIDPINPTTPDLELEILLAQGYEIGVRSLWASVQRRRQRPRMAVAATAAITRFRGRCSLMIAASGQQPTNKPMGCRDDAMGFLGSSLAELCNHKREMR